MTAPIGALVGTAHFSVQEAADASASAWPPTDEQAAHAQLTLERCETVRAWLGGGRLILSSLVRSPAENAELEGSTPHSAHLRGDGADLVPEDSAVLADAVGLLAPHQAEFTGAGIDRIIVSADHLHVTSAAGSSGAGLLLVENPDGSFSAVDVQSISAPAPAPTSASDLGLVLVVLVLFFALILGTAHYLTRG